jgi:hypothetical protein
MSYPSPTPFHVLKLTGIPGQRPRTKLGSNHLPISQRNRQQPTGQAAHGGHSIQATRGEGVVGQEKARSPIRIHEGARQ